ncbi:MAG: NUDIX hydrolase [Rickettsiales bacterium]|jgi:ADP-ribose pyrophosphatase YjhB (NUDIX family)|nr:NUDIX hydrolase [Rickettsiales bacterium]
MEELKNYEPYDEEEERTKRFLMDFYDRHAGDIFTRENPEGHMTASAWVVNPARDKTLMAYHNIYGSFAWLGGHADGDTDLRRVAKRELMEETGLKNPRYLTDDIFSLDMGTVKEHVRRGKIVPPHYHIDFCYLFEAGEDEILRIAEGENSAVKWIPVADMEKEVLEKHMLPVYAKLAKKVKERQL